MLGETGIEDSVYAILDRAVEPAQDGRADLLVRKVFHAVEEHGPAGGLIGVAGHVAVFAHKIGQLRHGIRCGIGNAVRRQNLGVHPVAVHFALQHQHLGIRADGVKIFFTKLFACQAGPLHHETVTLEAGILLDIIGHEGQALLFGGTHDRHAQIRVLKSYAGGDMHMAVDNARHDELAAKVCNLAFIGRKPGLATHIDKLSVFYNQGCGLGIFLVTSVDCCVPKNVVCFHGF